MLRINKLEVTGSKGVSSIEFGENLTIIMGKTETGKTTIYKCIDYLFGAKKEPKHQPFLASTGYNLITGYFSTSLGDLKIIREINSNELKVETKIKEIDTSQLFSIDPQNKRWIGAVFNTILGVNSGLKVPWSKDGKMKQFSWRTLKRAFMINEKNVNTNDSIILPTLTTDHTSFLSHLLYILYETDFTDFDAEDGSKVKKIKKAAVQKYIATKKEFINRRLEEIKSQIKEINIDDINIEDTMNNIKKNLEEINKSIKKAVDDNQLISKEMVEVQKRIAGSRLTIERFKALETQYTSDVKRLSFIVDSEKITSAIPKKTTCPFCNGTVEKQQDKSFIEASRGELSRTIENVNELNDAHQDIINDLKQDTAELAELEKKKDDIRKLLNEDLKPIQVSLEKQLVLYQQIIEFRNALALYSEMDTSYDADFKDYDKLDSAINYIPRKLFPDNFKTDIESYFADILQKTNFKPINKIEFDMQTFDVTVNDNPKSNRSKGYSSFFNSILILALRCYVNEYAKINPHFYLIDSPLFGLMTETSDENNEDDLRKGFFKYLFEEYGDDQIIVIENTENKEMPKFKFDSEKVKIHNFTMDKENGRYGFLFDVFQD